jgi:hypothetical protein
MLLSRFWYIFLAAAAGAAAAAALVAQSVINTRSDEALADALGRDRVVIDAMLRLEARSRLDRIAFITVDTKLGALLKQAQGLTDEKRLHLLAADAKTIMRAQIARIVEAAGSGSPAGSSKDLEPDIAFALDADGRIIGQLGPLEPNPPGSSLATFPLVRRALQGYVRDDVWVYDRRVYRMAARPVMSGTEYAGAIIHGYRIGTNLPDTLSNYIGGASIAFFFGNEILSSHIATNVAAAPQSSELASALPRVLTRTNDTTSVSNEVIALQSGGRAIFGSLNGSAGALGAGYAIARPRKVLTSPEQLFQQASQDDVKALPMPQLGGGALLLALIGLFFVYVERDRHLNQLMAKTAEIGAGERDRLIVTEWRGGYRKLADKINLAIDHEVEKAAERAPTTRKRANLDEILGPTPEATGTPFFGFASDAEAGPPVSPAGTPKPALPLPKAAVSPAQSKPAARASAAIPLPPPPSPPAPPPPAPSTNAALNVDDSANFNEDAHWRDIYQQYVATRRQCGEPTDTLTFDKFAVTLTKTRDQIIEKHGARHVRFSVQIKEGKAALKAQPIKR